MIEELNLDSDTMDLEFFVDDYSRVCVKIPWATGGHLSLVTNLNSEELKSYTGRACWGYAVNINSEFSESYESLFLKKHEWSDRVNGFYRCTACNAVSKGDINNVFNSAIDKVRSTCTQYKFEKYLTCLALSCHDDLENGGTVIFHLSDLPHQFAELEDIYDIWKILKS